ETRRAGQVFAHGALGLRGGGDGLTAAEAIAVRWGGPCLRCGLTDVAPARSASKGVSKGASSMEPIAYHLTWTTYGTWLPGDERGWVESGKAGIQAPDPEREWQARQCMVESAVVLTPGQRDLVEQTIRDHCRIRGWVLHAVNARSNHIHVV